MKRTHKFRGRDTDGNWHYGSYYTARNIAQIIDETGAYNVIRDSIGEFTGFTLADTVELFEDDIVFEDSEIENDNGETTKLYFICTWMKEWGCFTLLLIDEYVQCIEQGIMPDEYTLCHNYMLSQEDCSKIHYHSNIHEGLILSYNNANN